MTGERRKFRREGEEARREALVSAALALVAEGGAQAATVRAIAERAGVTPGLIRHYFHSKEDLTRAAYTALMSRMTEDNAAVLAVAPDTPEARLAAFVAASLRPPVVDAERLGLWAAFLHGVRTDPRMRAVHEAGLSRLPRPPARPDRRPAPPRRPGHAARPGHCLQRGDRRLWLEGSALPEAFAPGELSRIGVASVGAILGLDLSSHLPEVLA